MEELAVAAWYEQNAVALHNLAWHYSNTDACPAPSISYDADIIVDAQRQSAELWYPLGQYGALVQNFRSLDEGIEFTMDNPWHRVPGAGEP